MPEAGPATPGTADASQDPFAAVLAALSGALGVPVTQLAVQVVDPAETGGEPVGDAGPTGAWAAATQRQAVPGIAPAVPGVDQQGEDATTPVDTPTEAQAPGRAAKAFAPESGPVGPWHATHGTEVRATRPAAEHAAFTRLDAQPETPALDPTTPAPTEAADAPAVPVGVDPTPVAPAPDVVVAPQVAAPAASPAAAAAERTAEVGPARHVQPAVLEAARGLRHEGGGRTSLVVRLDPPELGAVLVRLTVQDGRVDVQLRTPDLVARNDLQAQQYDVQQVLRDQGFDLSSFDVAHGDVFPGNQGDSPDRGTPQRSRGADGRVDDHHPVTDDGPAPEPSGTWL
jgi:flagellar hook-length control protein FliK